MTYVIVEACIGVKDRACVDVCPVDCIYEGEDQLYIHPDECIDCGACEPECPVTAIFPEEDVPREHDGVHREEQRGLQQRHPAGAAEALTATGDARLDPSPPALEPRRAVICFVRRLTAEPRRAAPGSNCLAATPEPSLEGPAAGTHETPTPPSSTNAAPRKGFSRPPGGTPERAVVSAGRSTGGRCPLPGSRPAGRRESPRPCARAASGGVSSSSSPTMTRVGSPASVGQQAGAVGPVAHGGQRADDPGHRRRRHHAGAPAPPARARASAWPARASSGACASATAAAPPSRASRGRRVARAARLRRCRPRPACPSAPAPRTRSRQRRRNSKAT